VKLCGHKVLDVDDCRDYIIRHMLVNEFIEAQQRHIEVLEALLELELAGIVKRTRGPPTEEDLEEHRAGLRWLRSL